MAGIPKPVVDPRFGPAWTPILQNAQNTKQQTMALNSGAPQGNLLDQWGNTIQLQGSNLNQRVTIGASYGVSGVLVSTGIASGTSGLAVQSGPAITTITLTQGSTAATVGAVTGASLAKGQVIGAANVSDPSSGTPTPAITPGTTIAAVSGSSVTLSQGAAESGTSLYCAAAAFIVQQDTGWESLSLASGFIAGAGYTPAGRLSNSSVYLCGQIINNTGVNTSAGQTWATLPVGVRPAQVVNAVLWTITTAGVMSYAGVVSNGGALPLDGLVFRAF